MISYNWPPLGGYRYGTGAGIQVGQVLALFCNMCSLIKLAARLPEVTPFVPMTFLSI